MTALVALALAAAVAGASAPGASRSDAAAAVRAALDARGALATAGAAAEVTAVEGAPPGCGVDTAELPRAVQASGRVGVLLRGGDALGRSCSAWAWAWLRVTAPTPLTARRLAAGEPLAGAVRWVRREVPAGRPPLAAVPDGATAVRELPAGATVDEGALRVGPPPGEAVAVVLHDGLLTVEQRGRAVPCRRLRACALLPSGRRVEGEWHGGRIELEQP